MNILVIGNGFDLAHGLPTTYGDFLGFIKYFNMMHDETIENIEILKNAKNFKKLDKRVQDYLLNEKAINKEDKLMKELHKLSLNNVWIKHLENCSKNNELKGKNWIDFESEIAEVIKALDCLKTINTDILINASTEITRLDLQTKSMDFIDKIKKESDKIVFSSSEFHGHNAKMIIDKINNELNELVRCLEIYLEDVVGNIKIEAKLPDICSISKIDKLISFNYTDTFKRVYDKNKVIEYDYIHGNLDISRGIEENNMVLGIDEYLEGNDRNKELDFIYFKKYFQRIYKKTGCKYKKWIEKIKSSKMTVLKPEGHSYSNNIYIYGHSLDITDKDILKELLMLPRTQITIFYYNKNDYAQKITNLVGIIGQDELIESVHGENPRVIFKEIQK